ncbi:MAG: acyl carrier protein [Myxococcota bacterium]
MSEQWTKERILQRVTEILTEYFEVPAEDVRPTAHVIDDLDLDSIDAIDLAVSLEEDTGLSMSDEELKGIRLVQDIVDLVHAKMQSA